MQDQIETRVIVDLDEEFPLGDVTADDSADVVCPYCGEPAVISLDPGSGNRQEYVEDCPVCCRPNVIHVEVDDDGDVRVWAQGE